MITPPTSTPLTDPEIDVLVARYVREMARYEEVATLIERRLRRALRADAIRALLSSRAKHPDDLRGKLERHRDDARYTFQALDQDLNEVVTDLAGCRVMIYRPSDIGMVERLVKETLAVAPLPTAFEQHDKSSGYRATHVLVRVRDEEERLSLRGATCEVQISSLAAHVFNELEHDIGYKDDHCAPTEGTRGALEEVRRLSWVLDRSVERLVVERTEALRMQTAALESAEELRFTLEQIMDRPLDGDFARLFQLLDVVFQPLTAFVLASLGSPVFEAGKRKAAHLGITDDDDVHFALGLFDDYADILQGFVRAQRGPATLLKRAIVRAAEERKMDR